MQMQKPEAPATTFDATVPVLLECFFVDVGQGNCTILKTYTSPNKYSCWMFDAGSNHYPDYFKTSKWYDMSKQIIKLIGTPQELNVVISHPDVDHYNLVRTILAAPTEDKGDQKIKTLKKVFYSTAFVNDKDMLPFFKKMGKGRMAYDEIKLTPVSPGTGWTWDGETATSNPDIQFLNYKPPDKKENKKNKKEEEEEEEEEDEEETKTRKEKEKDIFKNAHSAMIQINYCKQIILLTGDANASTFDWANDYLPNDILCFQAPHHGADNGVSPTLLKKLNPELIIISSHVNSKHEHPTPKVIDNFLKYFMSREKTTQRQPWHLIPFLRQQYLHELPENVLNWHNWTNVIPFAMGKEAKKGKPRAVYATNLGLYSTTWAKTYCLTLSKKIKQYKFDYLTLDPFYEMTQDPGNNKEPLTPNQRFPRDYFLQELGHNFEKFSKLVFGSLKTFFPQNVTWTGFCIPNDVAMVAFLNSQQNAHLENVQFIDLRPCIINPLQNLAKCLKYLNSLISLSISDNMLEKEITPEITYVIIRKLLGRKITVEEVDKSFKRQGTTIDELSEGFDYQSAYQHIYLKKVKTEIPVQTAIQQMEEENDYIIPRSNKLKII